jgi:hypothetical protein
MPKNARQATNGKQKTENTTASRRETMSAAN